MTSPTADAHTTCIRESAILAYCRAGFEAECAAELDAVAQTRMLQGQATCVANSGYVLWHGKDPEQTQRLITETALNKLIFTRDWFLVMARCRDLPPHQRVGPLVECARTVDHPLLAEVSIETPDSDATKPLAPLCRGIGAPLHKALTSARVITQDTADNTRLRICFISTHEALIGLSERANSSPWPTGIPRLKSSRDAPSRSTMKLEEALLQFDVMAHLKPGMTAVDLGAAPGGWTWLLTQHHVRVVAIDNGALQRSLLDSGLVEHRREDGFRFQPKKRVDWLVCDMVDKPRRIATLVAQWLAQGWCNRVIANLKLPMKKRYDEVVLCLAIIEQHAAEAGLTIELRAKQLYHDREEITLYAAVSRHRSR